MVGPTSFPSGDLFDHTLEGETEDQVLPPGQPVLRMDLCAPGVVPAHVLNRCCREPESQYQGLVPPGPRWWGPSSRNDLPTVASDLTDHPREHRGRDGGGDAAVQHLSDTGHRTPDTGHRNIHRIATEIESQPALLRSARSPSLR